MPTISSPRNSGVTSSARKPARKMISFAAEELPRADRAPGSVHLPEGRCDIRLIEADVPLRQRLDQLLIHAVGGPQMKFALRLSKT